MINKAEMIAPLIRGLTIDNGTGAFVTFSKTEIKGVNAVQIELADAGDASDAARILSAGINDYKALNSRLPEAVNVSGIGSFAIKSGYSRIAVVTGGAQGFGAGIAEKLAEKNIFVFIADMNLSGAESFVSGLNGRFGKEIAAAVEVNASVEAMIDEVCLKAGGLDLFVNNAGVLKAGSVKELALKDFDFVTKVNYTGYFICVKYASRIMALQNQAAAEIGEKYYTDVIQINSKSGLEGSNKNGAYAGGKFGGIGLTQSFALELITDNIKVNSICPGNFFEGPLWADPDRGLFMQYLKTGKVPGAKTVEDVKAFYEAKVPMGRGCTPEDVARALFYLVDQKYETGQALPVTGGQVMLK